VLVPGCGIGNQANATKCVSYIKEDTNTTVVIKGYFSPNINYNERVFRLDSLPTKGVFINETSKAPLAVGAIIRANNITGDLHLLFVPPSDYFNGLCGANIDAPININASTCPGNPIGVFQDGMGHGIKGCTNTTHGCPILFSYSVGAQRNNNVMFSRSFVNGSEIFVFGVNDNRSALLQGDSSITFPRNAIADAGGYYSINNFVAVPFQYADPDDDIVRVGFRIQMPLSTTYKIKPTFVSFNVSGTQINRVTFTSGQNCYRNGCFGNVPLSGRAYKSDLNSILSALTVFFGRYTAIENMVIRVWDPVSFPESFNASLNFTNTQHSAELITSFAFSPFSPSGNPGLIPIEIAGIAGGVIAGTALLILVFIRLKDSYIYSREDREDREKLLNSFYRKSTVTLKSVRSVGSEE